MLSFKWRHYEKDIILLCIRWYLSYPLSYRHLQEMMHERGLTLVHSTINRWLNHYTPKIRKRFTPYKKRVLLSWRLDETYIKLRGIWVYLYRAVDKSGKTIDFYLSSRRDRISALKFLQKAIGNNGVPSVINIDKSGANKAGIETYNREEDQRILIRQCKYLNNIVEQDHRGIKRITNPMLGFKSFKSAEVTLEGIELIRMTKKGQMRGFENCSVKEQFDFLAA
jgi:putative transposase